MPTSTSNSPSRRSRMISIRSMVATSECIYRTRMPAWPGNNSVRSSAIFLVRVVTSTRSFRWARARISLHQIVDLALHRADLHLAGPAGPVGRMTCSTILVRPLPLIRPRRGGDEHRLIDPAPQTPRISAAGCRRRRAGGSRTRTRASFRARSPLYMARDLGQRHMALVHKQQKIVGKDSPAGS